MEAKDYCSSMESELTAWKAKLYDLMRKFDQISSSQKQEVQPHIQSLHQLMKEIDTRIDTLRRECPTNWQKIQQEIGAKAAELKGKYEKIYTYPGFSQSKP